MGEAARFIAAVAPLAIALLLIFLVHRMVQRVEKTGGFVEVDWKTVAFRIKCSFTPEQLAPSDGAGTKLDVPPESPAREAQPPPAEGDAADPPSGGGGP